MDIKQIILQALEIAEKEIAKEIEQQGHRNTGKLIDSIEPRVKQIADGIRGELYMLDRYQFINNPTPGSRIPFGGRTGRGGTSRYIQALIDFFKSKGAQNPISAAFATAWKQKKEGRPTKGSYLFAKNGRILDFLTHALDAIEEKVYNLMEREIGKMIELEIFKIAV